ncbi:DUF3053 family protein [Bordetella hinzii]|nr:DUF3053 family protein [Bordetella hinzii]QWF42846.1 DUF3053 family protein [Bordetella hinzii]QWF47387.1 DUF3053 family protein [Bordetella hinzii]QWF51922.1 DUF3053 family protein [Bordetella hinzii]QWF56459.1 DUF3053 family protein [Bordetella hinzii]
MANLLIIWISYCFVKSCCDTRLRWQQNARCPRPRGRVRLISGISFSRIDAYLLSLFSSPLPQGFSGPARRGALRAVLAACLALGAQACTQHEPEERAALIHWLRESGGAAPDAQTLKGFGDYAGQYAVIGDYQQALSRAAGTIRQALTELPVHALEDLSARRERLLALRASLHRDQQDLEQAYRQALSQRADLLQAADLKRAYDQAFESLVVERQAAIGPLWDLLEAPLSLSLKVADFAAVHQDQIATFGSLTQVRDPSVRDALNALLTALNAQSRALERAAALCAALAWCPAEPAGASPTMAPAPRFQDDS